VPALAAAVCLSALVLVAALTGAGPLGSSHEVRARDECRLAPVMRDERVPRLVQGPEGPAIEYRVERVRRFERGCSPSAGR
jgi:hypothetical protein